MKSHKQSKHARSSLPPPVPAKAGSGPRSCDTQDETRHVSDPQQARHASLTSQQRSSSRLNESIVQEAFHALIKQALIQAQAEGLLEEDVLAMAASTSRANDEASTDAQIIAASLALYFAALQAQGSPPTISSASTGTPRIAGSSRASASTSTAFQLTLENCPSSFVPFFTLWQRCVPAIQHFNLEKRHDLALILCERSPQSSPIRIDVAKLARDIKRVALDIIQRQTFQQRFQDDVDTALAASLQAISTSGMRYDVPPTTTSPTEDSSLERHGSTDSRRYWRHSMPRSVSETAPAEDAAVTLIRETLFAALGDCVATYPRLRQLLRSQLQSSRTRDGEANGKGLVSRCYFASLCMAIVDVSLDRVKIPDMSALEVLSSAMHEGDDAAFSRAASKRAAAAMLGVGTHSEQIKQAWQQAYVSSVALQDQTFSSPSARRRPTETRLTLSSCPLSHRRLLVALFSVALHTQQLAASDMARAISDAQAGRATDERQLLVTALRRQLLGEDLDVASVTDGAATGSRARRITLESTDATSAHVQETSLLINKMALAVFAIPSFRQRQVEAFQVLASIDSV